MQVKKCHSGRDDVWYYLVTYADHPGEQIADGPYRSARKAASASKTDQNVCEMVEQYWHHHACQNDYGEVFCGACGRSFGGTVAAALGGAWDVAKSTLDIKDSEEKPTQFSSLMDRWIDELATIPGHLKAAEAGMARNPYGGIGNAVKEYMRLIADARSRAENLARLLNYDAGVPQAQLERAMFDLERGDVAVHEAAKELDKLASVVEEQPPKRVAARQPADPPATESRRRNPGLSNEQSRNAPRPLSSIGEETLSWDEPYSGYHFLHTLFQKIEIEHDELILHETRTMRGPLFADAINGYDDQNTVAFSIADVQRSAQGAQPKYIEYRRAWCIALDIKQTRVLSGHAVNYWGLSLRPEEGRPDPVDTHATFCFTTEAAANRALNTLRALRP